LDKEGGGEEKGRKIMGKRGKGREGEREKKNRFCKFFLKNRD